MPEPGPRVERPPTIRDVARHAGVSKSLVSLVLQGKGRVGEASRAAVLQAIDELGYRPNRQARALSRLRSDTVGVVVSDLGNPWFVDLLAGLTTTLHGSGLSPLLADSRLDQGVGVSSVEKLLAQNVDGLVIVGTNTEWAALEVASREVPVVLAGTLEPELPHVDVVVNDDLLGSREATGHLLGLGHRRMVHLSGPGKVGSLRSQGFRDAIAEAGLDAEGLVVAGGSSEESGYAAARRLLAGDERPSAIFAFNDMVAIGALSAADDLGLSVPGDLSIVGYDNTYLAHIRHISLTSVNSGNFAVGAQAGRFLIERLADPALPARTHLGVATLEMRGSSGAIRS